MINVAFFSFSLCKYRKWEIKTKVQNIVIWEKNILFANRYTKIWNVNSLTPIDKKVGLSNSCISEDVVLYVNLSSKNWDLGQSWKESSPGQLWKFFLSI